MKMISYSTNLRPRLHDSVNSASERFHSFVPSFPDYISTISSWIQDSSSSSTTTISIIASIPLFFGIEKSKPPSHFSTSFLPSLFQGNRVPTVESEAHNKNHRKVVPSKYHQLYTTTYSSPHLTFPSPLQKPQKPPKVLISLGLRQNPNMSTHSTQIPRQESYVSGEEGNP